MVALQPENITVKRKRQGCGEAPVKTLEEARNSLQFGIVGGKQTATPRLPRLKDLLSDITTLAEKVKRPTIPTVHREQAIADHLPGNYTGPLRKPNKTVSRGNYIVGWVEKTKFLN